MARLRRRPRIRRMAHSLAQTRRSPSRNPQPTSSRFQRLFRARRPRRRQARVCRTMLRPTLPCPMTLPTREATLQEIRCREPESGPLVLRRLGATRFRHQQARPHPRRSEAACCGAAPIRTTRMLGRRLILLRPAAQAPAVQMPMVRVPAVLAQATRMLPPLHSRPSGWN